MLKYIGKYDSNYIDGNIFNGLFVLKRKVRNPISRGSGKLVPFRKKRYSFMNDNQSQTRPAGSESTKPAATPEQAKPAVVKPAEAPSQKPADAAPKSNA